MEKSLIPMSIDDINNAAPVEIELPEEEPDLTIVDISIEAKSNHGENLAETLPGAVLASIGSEILDDIRINKNSRKDWEQGITDGFSLLGMKIEERAEPWSGACGVFHSLLSEATIKFQSEMIMETFPADGPVDTKIIGKSTKEKEEAAERVRNDMNWQLTDNMPEFRTEQERLYWNLGFMGSGFKKVYYDPNLGRQTSMFVSAEDVILSYGCTEISQTPFIAQLMRKTENEIKKLIAVGFYQELPLGEPNKEIGDIEKKKQEITGFSSMEDNRHVLYEVHAELEIEEDEVARPYVVTIDSMGQIYALYRNWEEDDELCKKKEYFVHYCFIPGMGPYGFGYCHILGGYAKGATSTLRQLVDAGTLANLPGGLKARGLRIKGDETPIAPGEFRDVDVPAGSIRDNIMNLPYKEPSQVLFQLYQEIVDEGRSLASTADMKVADMNQQAPVGTTLAIIERMLKVMSAVQARAHVSMKKEFKLLRNIIRDYSPDDYDYDVDDGDRNIKRSDYDNCEIIPVSDPNASSTTQRMAQYQAALQLSQSAPQMYDLPLLHRQTLRALGMKNADEIVPDKTKIKPTDPVSENMNILNGKPVKAFITQDHEAHIAVHMAAAQDPAMQQIIGQDPNAQAIQQALQAHLMEHMAFKYKADIEAQMGVDLPGEDEETSPEVENKIARLAAEAAPLVLQMHNQKAAQQKMQEQQQDPMVQAQQQELQLKQQSLQLQGQKIAAEVQGKQQSDTLKATLERERLASNERIAQLNAQKAQLIAQINAQKALAVEEQKQSHDKIVTGFNAGIGLRKPQ